MNVVSQDGSWSQVSPAGLNSFGLDHPVAMLSSSDDHVITVFNGNAMKRGFASYSRSKGQWDLLPDLNYGNEFARVAVILPDAYQDICNAR